MTGTLARLLAIAAPAKALPALLAGVLAAAFGIALIAAAAWIIASAALQPPLSALALAITMVRACGIGRAVFHSPAMRSCSWQHTAALPRRFPCARVMSARASSCTIS